ncbi:GNAT family N-acetyltransferase [Actinomadura sp. 7K534]|uniref:GNAT family N-acetyltransferase n=1 Tax=Actinomadura sp. 7K534 TaxID=2530366 RepID=UPI001043C7D5|nr:GNAT family N-acetyltransferase [Actinomadura sp. 7K534]TDB88926.1 GNAT family N-acetyltransferase [Actinomadura sp. 7K534]
MDTETGARQRSRATRIGYRIRPARPDELDDVLGLIDHAAEWLREKKNTTQWANPWPSVDDRRKRVYEALLNRETWLLFDRERLIGTVSIRLIGHEELWTARERETEAVYLHRLVVHRDYTGLGLGAELIEWAGRKGAAQQRKAELIRIDVWTDNTELHDYYRRQGFKDVAIRTTSDRTPSGALFEKPLRTGPPSAVTRITERRRPQAMRRAELTRSGRA